MILAVANYYVVPGKAWKMIIEPHSNELPVGLAHVNAQAKT